MYKLDGPIQLESDHLPAGPINNLNTAGSFTSWMVEFNVCMVVTRLASFHLETLSRAWAPDLSCQLWPDLLVR